MKLLVILTALIFAERETFRDANFGNTKHWNRFLIRLIVPYIANRNILKYNVLIINKLK